ncbi:MAG: hypothetical protein MUP58_01070 [Candidatus Nanohaloarchaeota archaeon QJJ-9]|nr:hypothetical protein [Candidatus Nanohaloarchaeota archaeon QJJ-9]
MSLKPLPSSLRGKERYLIFKIESDTKFGLGEVVKAVWRSFINFLGEQTVSGVNPWIMGDLFNRDKQVGAVRVSKDYVEDARAALALTRQVNNHDVCFHVLGVTGTIESARSKYIRAID